MSHTHAAKQRRAEVRRLTALQQATAPLLDDVDALNDLEARLAASRASARHARAQGRLSDEWAGHAAAGAAARKRAMDAGRLRRALEEADARLAAANASRELADIAADRAEREAGAVKDARKAAEAIGGLRERVAEQEGEIAGLRGRVEEMKGVIKERERVIQERERVIKEKERSLSEANARADGLQADRDSWRARAESAPSPPAETASAPSANESKLRAEVTSLRTQLETLQASQRAPFSPRFPPGLSPAGALAGGGPTFDLISPAPLRKGPRAPLPPPGALEYDVVSESRSRTTCEFPPATDLFGGGEEGVPEGDTRLATPVTSPSPGSSPGEEPPAEVEVPIPAREKREEVAPRRRTLVKNGPPKGAARKPPVLKRKRKAGPSAPTPSRPPAADEDADGDQDSVGSVGSVGSVSDELDEVPASASNSGVEQAVLQPRSPSPVRTPVKRRKSAAAAHKADAPAPSAPAPRRASTGEPAAAGGRRSRRARANVSYDYSGGRDVNTSMYGFVPKLGSREQADADEPGGKRRRKSAPAPRGGGSRGS